MLLDQLPPELLLQIFRQISLDDRNQTLCSLAVVSRRVHDVAISALYETVVLDTDASIEKFALMTMLEPPPPILQLVRNISPWSDTATIFNSTSNAEELCIEIILARCPNLTNVQTQGKYLQSLCAESARSLQTLFVWLASATTFDRITLPPLTSLERLHVADLQSIVSRGSAGLSLLADALNAQSFPRLRFFSSTWAPYQMFDDDHARLHTIAITVLGLPSLQRFVVRHLGLDIDLPSLRGLRDPRIFVLAYDPRDPVRADNLQTWALSALGQLSMWTGKQIGRGAPATALTGTENVQVGGVVTETEREDESVDGTENENENENEWVEDAVLFTSARID
ncbi:hypothetical protein EXIGLDRAFT_758539 [Exidia glandulosa HHB12029]|uniref:F-box domain-containing protein n=1 Tax=Exidia glandulosa HHB12029 TaxID=1314781 RepID=A0A165QYE0_EXIGL|nr:hypothetical protein EXIGLDRAFT_758539 [Exidia glandulosa HHB12029]